MLKKSLVIFLLFLIVLVAILAHGVVVPRSLWQPHLDRLQARFPEQTIEIQRVVVGLSHRPHLMLSGVQIGNTGSGERLDFGLLHLEADGWQSIKARRLIIDELAIKGMTAVRQTRWDCDLRGLRCLPLTPVGLLVAGRQQMNTLPGRPKLEIDRLSMSRVEMLTQNLDQEPQLRLLVDELRLVTDAGTQNTFKAAFRLWQADPQLTATAEEAVAMAQPVAAEQEAAEQEAAEQEAAKQLESVQVESGQVIAEQIASEDSRSDDIARGEVASVTSKSNGGQETRFTMRATPKDREDRELTLIGFKNEIAGDWNGLPWTAAVEADLIRLAQPKREGEGGLFQQTEIGFSGSGLRSYLRREDDPSKHTAAFSSQSFMGGLPDSPMRFEKAEWTYTDEKAGAWTFNLDLNLATGLIEVNPETIEGSEGEPAEAQLRQLNCLQGNEPALFGLVSAPKTRQLKPREDKPYWVWADGWFKVSPQAPADRSNKLTLCPVTLEQDGNQ